jgi:signal transduction histidine kinase
MHAQPAGLLGLWRRLTEPPETLKQPEIRRRLRLLLSILVVLLTLDLLFLAYQWIQLLYVTDPVQRHWLIVVFPVILGLAFVCLAIAYVLGRRGHETASGMLVVCMTAAAAYVLVLLTRSSDTIGFTVIAMVLSSILLPRRTTIAFLILTIAAVAVMPLLAPEISFWNISGALILIVPIGALSLVSAAIHDRDVEQIESQTRALIENEERLLGARKMEAVACLSAGIAHEFNNIVMAIIGYSEVITNKPPDSAKQYSRLIKDAGLRAKRLTEQLLSFSRQQLLRPQATDLNRLIAGLEQTLLSVQSDRIRLSLHLDSQPQIAMVDPALVGRAIQTLVLRARENIDREGDISIQTETRVLAPDQSESAFQPGRYCTITVSDSGPPVDREVLARIFEPYFTEGEFGTGDLDLAAAYGIIQQSNGRIDARSNPRGGNAFVVALPESRSSP